MLGYAQFMPTTPLPSNPLTIKSFAFAKWLRSAKSIPKLHTSPLAGKGVSPLVIFLMCSILKPAYLGQEASQS